MGLCVSARHESTTHYTKARESNFFHDFLRLGVYERYTYSLFMSTVLPFH